MTVVWYGNQLHAQGILNKSFLECLLSQERRYSERFQLSIAFLSRRDISKSLEENICDAAENVSHFNFLLFSFFLACPA